jgi:hypothetical protein
MELIDLKGITWMEDDPQDDARFWEVYCAVNEKNPGPPERWGNEGRALRKGFVPPPNRQRTTPTLESLRCDRGLQWTALDNAIPERSHDVLIVPGLTGQAHDHFSRRVREMLTPMPPRSIVSIYWRKRPSNREDFFAALAEGLEVSGEGLAREMAERLSDSNLVLLHPCIRARFTEPTLISYYTLWLPQLIHELGPRMSLKCVQPVEWSYQPGPLASVLAWLRLRPDTHEEGKPDAEKFIGLVRAGTAPALRALRLQDLADITDADLDEFCQLVSLTESQKAWFLSRIKSRRPRTSRDIFDAIDAFLSDARSEA